MISTNEFESRIIEVILKDGNKEYFPQIRFKEEEYHQTKDGWMWLREQQLGKMMFDRYELRANDFKCSCQTIEESIEKIKKYKKQREEIIEKNRLFDEKKIERETSIEKTNILTDF
jgi:hypothetical protein